MPWIDVYLTDTPVKNAKPDRLLVVDVGGSKGHDLTKFHLRHPDIPEGSLVLQDLPDVLNELVVDDTISIHSHDFFEPQPVKGARVYFMRRCGMTGKIHRRSRSFLTLPNLYVEPRYSKVRIHESLAKSLKPLARVITSDITMIVCFSVKDRVEAEWRALVESAESKVLNIWSPPYSFKNFTEV